jgi:hypothetical protein
LAVPIPGIFSNIYSPSVNVSGFVEPVELLVDDEEEERLSHNSSVMDADDFQLQAVESDESL